MAGTNKKKHNWAEIRDQYICSTGEISLNEHAKKCGVNASTLRLRAAKEKWTDKRKQFLAKVAAGVEKVATKKEVKRRVDMLKTADAMKAVGRLSLNRLAEELKNDSGRRLDTNEIRLMLKDAIEIEARVLGVPEVIQMTTRELDARILEELDALAAVDAAGEAD